MARSFLSVYLVLLSLCALGQTDSLTISDTIGSSRQRVFLQTLTGYSYYGASQLTGSQLQPVLKRSPDVLTQKLLRQSRRLSRIATGLGLAGLGLVLESYLTAGRRYGPNGGVQFAGDVLIIGGLFPQGTSSRRLDQAVAAHNAFLRNRPDEYLPPIVYTASRQWPLSLADTIGRKQVWLTSQYTYRGVRVEPTRQLSRLTASLNDRDVKAGLGYVRTIGTINGVIGVAGRLLLTSYLASALLNRRYRRVASTDSELLTTGLICLGTNFVLSRHANRVQRRWVERYNERLKETIPAAQ